MPATFVLMHEIPACNICHSEPAYADCLVPGYAWSYVCHDCFREHHCGLGTGVGQQLILATSATALGDDPFTSRWMAAVDTAMKFYVGCDSAAMADFGIDLDWRQMFDEGISPGVAAAKAIVIANEMGF